MSQPDHFLVLYRTSWSPAAQARDRPLGSVAGAPSLDKDEMRSRLSAALSASPGGPCPFHIVEVGPFLIAWQGQDESDPDVPFLRIAGNPYNVATARPALISANETIAAGELDGVFSAFAFDPVTPQGALVTDRFGLFPLYTCRQGDAVCFSTSLRLLLALLGRKWPLDAVGVHQMLTLRMVLGDRTFLQGVDLVPPATMVHWRAGKQTTKSYWTWDALEPAATSASGHACSTEELVHETASLLDQAVLRGIPPNAARVALLLDGGVGSRLLAAVLTRNGVRVRAWSNATGKDLAIAREVAQTLSMPLHVLTPFEQPETILPAHEAIDCGYHISRARGWPAARAAAEEGCAVLFDAVGGDVLFGSCALESATRVDEAFAALVDEPVRSAILSETAASLEQSLQASAARAGPRSREHFWMTSRLRKDAFGGPLANLAVLPGRFPYLTTRLFEHCLRLPPELRGENELASRLLQELFPSLARIGQTDKGQPGKPEGQTWWRRWGESVLARLRRKDRESLAEPLRGSDPLPAVLLDMLHTNTPTLAGVIPEEIVGRVLERQQTGEDVSDLLQGLSTVKHFAAWIEAGSGSRVRQERG